MGKAGICPGLTIGKLSSYSPSIRELNASVWEKTGVAIETNPNKRNTKWKGFPIGTEELAIYQNGYRTGVGTLIRRKSPTIEPNLYGL